jgi:outer membrane phospholipase A
LIAAFAVPAHAGVSYKLDRAAAAPGETVHVQAVFFNDGNAGARWHPPRQLVLQWRTPQGATIRSLARIDNADQDVNVPVNNFARSSWTAVVPTQAQGLQAISIEGEQALMALDATHSSTSTVASAPADVPVTDARTGKPVPPAEVAALGVSPQEGPAPAEAPVTGPVAETGAFDRVRNNISEFEPIYFDVSTRGRTEARFQISFKYRLFTPEAGQEPGFLDKLYLGYTQTSLWDLQGDSRPFIDTTFNPSLFYQNENMWKSQDQNWRAGLRTGLEHASNGKAGDDSRSVNDAFVQPALAYQFDGGSSLTFGPKIKGYFGLGEQNRDYRDYAGIVDWNLRWQHNSGLIATAMYRQGGDPSHRTTQLDLAWPLQRTFLHMNGYLHLQYFNGYGETLLGYDQRNKSQIGIGLSLVQ